MAGQQYLVTITPTANGVRFVPTVYGVDPDGPLPVGLSDLVVWDNQTAEPHQLFPVGTDGELDTGAEPITDPIAPWNSCSSAYQVPDTATTITYGCINHESERGIIQVIA